MQCSSFTVQNLREVQCSAVQSSKEVDGSLGFLLIPQDKISQEQVTKSVLANQIRPQQASKVFQKVTYIRVNSRPGVTYSYVSYLQNLCVNHKERHCLDLIWDKFKIICRACSKIGTVTKLSLKTVKTRTTVCSRLSR